MARIDIKRRIIHVGGFDAMPPEHVRARLLREHSRFQRCWGVTGEAGAYQPDIDLPRWTMVTSGEGWRVESEHIVLRWDDVIKAEHAQPPLKRWVGDWRPEPTSSQAARWPAICGTPPATRCFSCFRLCSFS